MQIFVFRTSITIKKAVAATASFFNEHPDIIDWIIDWENILRIEAKVDIEVKNLIKHIHTLGFSCEELED